MALVEIGGGLWMPRFHTDNEANLNFPSSSGSDAMTLDADEEEAQFFGYLQLAGGSGSKTFGSSGSAIGWLPGASITFAASSQLRVGIKKASTITVGSGPPARATIGAAAFDVYDELVGGTDTITSTTWREDAMSAGTPFTAAHGDLMAVCFHLNSTSGSPSVKVRAQASVAIRGFPAATLVTSGPTYSAQTILPNIVIKFDDGTLGWLNGTWITSSFAGYEDVGNTNYYGNLFRPTFDCVVDAVSARVEPSGTTNADIGIWNVSAGAPAALTNGQASFDPNVSNGAARLFEFLLPARITLAAGTDYFIGCKQNSASGMTMFHQDVDATAHHQINGLDANCYAVKSTAGAAFAAQASSKRRAAFFMRVVQVDDGAGGGGGSVGMVGC